MQKDFSYPLLVADLPNVENKYSLCATEENLEYIKEVLGVEKVRSFSTEIKVKLSHKSGIMKVRGTVDAELDLESVISLKPFTKKYHQNFEVDYDINATQENLDGAKFGLDDKVYDTIQNGKIDLVDIAIEHLALGIEDYPRKDGETFSFKSEFTEEEKPNPFAVLSALKK
ncbi:MAG: YceD family protein [Alphaproteobacteria bacterium]